MSTRMYKIIKYIDGGGFADVFSATLDGVNEVFALKMLREFRDPEQRRRFAREVKMIQDLNHDRIIKVVEANLTAEQPFYVMKFMTGGSLAHWAGRLPIANVRLLLVQLLDAIAHIHARNGLHRDIKPENLLVGPDGNFSVGDFGLGNNPRFTMLYTAHAAGTWGYMAPELSLPNAVATRAADVYSVGATIFNILTGIHPGKAKTLDPAIYKPGIPDDLRAIVLSMVSANPSQRPTASAARDALQGKPARGTSQTPPKSTGGSGALAALVGLGIFALVATTLSK